VEVAMSEQLRSPDREPTARDADLSRSHVLIVDDHAPSRRICAGYCDLFDHTSETVSGGDEAIEALRRERFHVVVMNVHMAAAGGLETLRAIRALPGPARETPVIGLTAVGRHDEAQRWLGAGLASVIAKPITAARLFAALSTVAEGQPDRSRSWAPVA
jgi:CheY-like chemotaxis protein